MEHTRGPGGSAGPKRQGERIGVVNWKGDCVYIEEKKLWNTSPRNRWIYPSGIEVVTIRDRAAVTWLVDSGRWELNEDFIASYGSVFGSAGVLLYHIAEGASGFWSAILFTVFASFIGFMIFLGGQTRTGSSDDNAIAGTVMISILFVWVALFLMSNWGDVLIEKEARWEHAVIAANQELDQLEIPGKNLFKPGANVEWGWYGAGESGFGTSMASLFGGLAMLLWVFAFTPFVCWVFWTYRWDIVTGFYDAFIPSRNAALYEKDRDKPIDASGIMRSMEIPSVDEILSGMASSFTAPFKAAAARNQARKSGKLAEQMRAQKGQLDAEADLFDAAADREAARVRKQTKEGE